MLMIVLSDHPLQTEKQWSDPYLSPDADAKAKKLGKSSSDINRQHDSKIANLARRNIGLEEQLSAAMASKVEADNNLSLVIDSKEVAS
jgi:hypothetical protein